MERGGSFSLRRSFRLPQLVAQRVRTLRGTPFPSELCASPLRRFRGFSPGASPPAAGGTGSGGPASGLPVRCGGRWEERDDRGFYFGSILFLSPRDYL